MSPMSSQQQWTRRVRYSDQNLRVSDADRNAVAELLTQHYADGRLDQGEFDERVSRTMAAKTRGDLAGLFDDLPDTGAGGPGQPGEPAVPYRARRNRGGILRPLLLIALVLIVANVTWHAVASMFFIGPALWAVAIIAIVLLLARSHHHH